MRTLEDAAFILERSHVGAFGWMLVIGWPGLPLVALDVALLDEIEADESGLLLRVDDTEVHLFIADGMDEAKRVAEALRPFTRSSPITTRDAYEDARRRTRLLDPSDWRLNVGMNAAILRGSAIWIGATSLTVGHVRDKAHAGETLDLPDGVRIQAALLLLVVAAEERAGGRQGIDVLLRRIAEFERATQRGPS